MPTQRLKLRAGALLLLASTAITVLSGCFGGITREDAEGTVPYGSVEQVAQRTTGAGSGSSIEGLGLLPLTEWSKPSTPLVEMPRVGTWWIIPQWSKDGLYQRDGVWLHLFLDKTPRWGLDLAMREGHQSLVSLTDLSTGPNGSLTFATSAVPDTLSKGIESFGRTYRLPYTNAPIGPSTPRGGGTNAAPPAQQRPSPPANAPTRSLPEATSTQPSPRTP